jgi:hypothetical protein
MNCEEGGGWAVRAGQGEREREGDRGRERERERRELMLNII